MERLIYGSTIVKGDVQEEIDNTLAVVFEYLNNVSSDIDLEHRETQEYHIPISEDHTVNVRITNEQVRLGRGIVTGNETYRVVSGKGYMYSFWIDSIHPTYQGCIIFTVNYTPYNTYGDSTPQIQVTMVGMALAAPNTYTLAESRSYIDGVNNAIIVKTGGYARFTKFLASDIYYTMHLRISGMNNNKVNMAWDYQW